MVILKTNNSHATKIKEACAMIMCEFNTDSHQLAIMLAKNLWRILVYDYEQPLMNNIIATI